MSKLLRILGLLFICLPLSLLATLLLIPFWSWLEANYGIESIGHSGPTEWCYVAMFFTMVALVLAVAGWRGAWK